MWIFKNIYLFIDFWFTDCDQSCKLRSELWTDVTHMFSILYNFFRTCFMPQIYIVSANVLFVHRVYLFPLFYFLPISPFKFCCETQYSLNIAVQPIANGRILKNLYLLPWTLALLHLMWSLYFRICTYHLILCCFSFPLFFLLSFELFFLILLSPSTRLEVMYYFH